MILDILVWIAYAITLFVAVYWVLLYFDKNKKHLQPLPKKTPRTWPGVTVVVPAYNEEESLERTLKSLLALDYPQQKLTIYIIDDGSTDQTPNIGRAIARKNRNVRYIRQQNNGKASALNNALAATTTPFFACLDADSHVLPQSAKAMVRAFTADPELQIATPVMRVAEPKTLWQKFQRVEYLAAMLLVRLMASLEGNYVAPGPFSMYRTATLRTIGGFDENNLVEDQEIAYRMQEYHGKIRQVEDAHVYTIAPQSFKELRKQRNRWMKGTLLNVYAYRRLLFNKKYGEFGTIIMPLTLCTFLLALIAVMMFLYYTLKPLYTAIKNLWIVGFDLMPYLENFRFTFSLLDADYTMLFIIWTMLAISVFILFSASQLFRDEITRYGRFYIIPYFFVYFLFLSFVLVQVLIEVILGRRQKW